MHLRDPEPCSDLRLREIVLEAQASRSVAREASAGRARAPAWPTPRRPRIPSPRPRRWGRPRSSSSRSAGAHRAGRGAGRSRSGALRARARRRCPAPRRSRRAWAIARARAVSCSDARWTCSARSCSSRGTRTVQRVVAEVALELAHDRRHGKRGERQPAVGVVAVDRLDQRERRDLDEIVVVVADSGTARASRLASGRNRATSSSRASWSPVRR